MSAKFERNQKDKMTCRLVQLKCHSIKSSKSTEKKNFILKNIWNFRKIKNALLGMNEQSMPTKFERNRNDRTTCCCCRYPIGKSTTRALPEISRV